MRKSMHDLVKSNILNKNLISHGDNVLLALSGGPDSVFLFYNLIKLKENLSFNLYASHINHMYRGEDAFNDEKFVKQLCGKYNIKLFVKRKHATEYAKELKVTEEEAGRILRYNFFKENLNEVGGGILAVAHNLNDQAETVLQRIIRGTGIDGLSAMSVKKDNIIRPMLNVSKSEILEYLHNNNYEYCVDITNSQSIYGRNKIRLDLIPYLENNFNPNIQNTLYRMSEAMDRDKKIIEKYIKKIFYEVLISNGDNKVILSIQKLKKTEPEEMGRILRYALEVLKGNAVNIEMKHINYVIDFVNNGKTGKKINLTEAVNAEISYDKLIFNKNLENIPKFKYNIVLHEPLEISEVGKVIHCKVLDVSEFNPENKDTISIDYDLIEGRLIVRNRLTGDSMIPCGMTGIKKIKDIFIDMKVPKEERDKKLIIADDNNILWLEDFRIHNSFKVTSSTRKILNITIREQLNG